MRLQSPPVVRLSASGITPASSRWQCRRARAERSWTATRRRSAGRDPPARSECPGTPSPARACASPSRSSSFPEYQGPGGLRARRAATTCTARARRLASCWRQAPARRPRTQPNHTPPLCIHNDAIAACVPGRRPRARALLDRSDAAARAGCCRCAFNSCRVPPVSRRVVARPAGTTSVSRTLWRDHCCCCWTDPRWTMGHGTRMGRVVGDKREGHARAT